MYRNQTTSCLVRLFLFLISTSKTTGLFSPVLTASSLVFLEEERDLRALEPAKWSELPS